MIDFTTKRVLTFDCYGTLIDWETGILSALQPIVTDHGVTANPEHLLVLYAQLEAAAEQGPYTSYRQLLMAVLRGLGERLGFTSFAAEQSRFADSVGDWPPFDDAPAALGALKRRFRLAIISNMVMVKRFVEHPGAARSGDERRPAGEPFRGMPRYGSPPNFRSWGKCGPRFSRAASC